MRVSFQLSFQAGELCSFCPCSFKSRKSNRSLRPYNKRRTHFFQEEVSGVDPTVFRRFFREEAEEVEDDINELNDKRCEMKDYKMPRRKTTRRKKKRENE